MSDQFGNKVDGEIWVQSQKPAFHQPLKTWREWAITYADGSIDDVHYEDESEARQNLQIMRRELKDYGVPEEYWPALMERTVETVATSWKILDV